MHEVMIGGDGGNITDVKRHEPGAFGTSAVLPLGRTENDVYLFYYEDNPGHDLSEEQERFFLTQGNRLASRYRSTERRLPGLGPMSEARMEQVLGARRRPRRRIERKTPWGAAQRNGGSVKAPEGLVWRARVAGGALAVGDVTGDPVIVFGTSGLVVPPGGEESDAIQVTATNLSKADFLAAFAPGAEKEEVVADARVLPVRTSEEGRHREWSDCVAEFSEESFEDWPVAGPRTAKWCTQFLRRRHAPLDHHLMMRSVAKVSPEDWGIQEHERLLRMLAVAAEYDQLDLTNCAWAEMALRQCQTIEWVYLDRLREIDGAGSSSGKGGGKSRDPIAPEELSAFNGVSRVGDLAMVCPTLLGHVKITTERDASILKAVRQARHERQARKTGKDPVEGG